MRAKLLTTVLRKGGAAASPLLTGLVGYWKLDEASAGSSPVTRLDSIGTYHLTDYNNTPSAAGKVGNAANMDGAASNNDYLQGASTTLFAPGDNPFSFSFWIYLNGAVTSERPPVYIDSFQWYVMADTVNNRWTFVTAGAVLRISGCAAGSWYHLVCWFDAPNDKIYMSINGAAPNVASALNAPNTNATTLHIGASNLPCLIDEVGYWSRLLTADERAILYNGGNGATYPF